MASIKYRNNAVKVVYNFKNHDGEWKQQWETYYTELEAKQRKVIIDDLQKKKDHAALLSEVIAYKEKMNALRVERGVKINTNVPNSNKPKDKNNLDKTFRDFIYKWLPFYERNKSNSVKTYDSKLSALRTHILPYFGHRIMSTITAQEYDDFIDYLNQKPCGGSKAYNKEPDENPMESINLGRAFKKWQQKNGIQKDSQIDFQGLRKSGQMHKIRLSQFNYQLVASLGGHSPEVLMNNYDEALETEKRALANMIEANFYTKQFEASPAAKQNASDEEAQQLAEALAKDPDLLQQVQLLLSGAKGAQSSKISQY